MSTAINIAQVHKYYGNLYALKGITLQIERGEFFGLLGPNGAGKSTLINIMAGLTRANGGRVSILDHDVAKHYRFARRCLGVVPQELVFDPFFTVREVLRIQAGYFGLGPENYAWIDELIDALMLSDKADTNMRALSGGMKRRVLIGQALVHKPEVVVLDEPTAGVDVELRKSLWAFIERLHNEGHTIVLTTHYLEEAEALCDRIAILNHGQVIALDTKEALLARDIGGKRSLHVTLARPLDPIPSALRSIVKKELGYEIVFELNNESVSILDVVDSLRQAGATILDLQTEKTDLEDIFIDLIQGKAS